MANWELKESQVLSAGTEAWAAIYPELMGNCMKVADDAIRSLTYHQLLNKTLGDFADRLLNYAEMMPLGEKTLADYDPKALVGMLVTSVVVDFGDWFGEVSKDPVIYDQLRQQALMRAIHHIFYGARDGQVELTDERIDKMRREFANPDYQGPSVWLWKVFNGIQEAVVEMYVIDRLVNGED